VKKKTRLAFDQEEVDVTLFGAGPAPELFGLLYFLEQNYPAINTVYAYLLDVSSSQWRFARSIGLEQLIRLVWKHTLMRYTWTYDIASPKVLSNHRW
jgi:hypothetical protein